MCLCDIIFAGDLILLTTNRYSYVVVVVVASSSISCLQLILKESQFITDTYSKCNWLLRLRLQARKLQVFQVIEPVCCL